MKREKGITLIALVVTIIILIILAAISINLVLGENGIIEKAKLAKGNIETSSLREQIELYRLGLEMESEKTETLKDKLIENNLVDGQELEEKGIANINDNILVISNFNGLKTLSENVANGINYEGKIIYVVNDIDCGASFDKETGELISGENFKPIGDSNVKTEEETNEDAEIKEFNGTFEGANYKISNLYIKENETTEFCTGLFGYVGEKGIVENLTITDSYIQGYYETGAFVGRNKGQIINCTNESIVIGNDHLTGGIVGRNTNLIEECVNRGNINGGIQTGGIVGNCDFGSNIIVRNCKNFGIVNSTETAVGGIIGGAYQKEEEGKQLTKIINCQNKGEIGNSSADQVGGICGHLRGKIQNCTNKGEIVGYQHVGGIVGVNRDGSIENCTNYEKVNTEYASGGGTAGSIFNGTASRCKNFGSVCLMENGYYGVGGIAGRLGNTIDSGKIEQCYNEGEIYNIKTSSNDAVQAGGIVGNAVATETNLAEIINCYNAGYVHGYHTAGIAGFARYVKIQNCYNIGKISVDYGTTRLGGIIAHIEQEYEGKTVNNEVENNYWLNTCGVTYGIFSISSNEGAESKTEGELKVMAEILGDEYIQENTKLNNGYPYLKENIPTN